MQISATTATVPTYSLHQPAADAQQNASARGHSKTQQAAEQAQGGAVKKVFTPAPPLRPNIQDYVDINRTLIALRKM